MTVVVPFDNSEISKAGLQRAQEIKNRSEALIAVVVIPNNNDKYARNHDWLIDDEEFDPETIKTRLSEIVTDIAPDARLKIIATSRYANPGMIAKEIRRFARDADARVVVIGSDNAGRVAATVGSVGRTVATDTGYNIYIVRTHPNR
ncbi:universal stress protein [Halovenus salina]|uniref:Universal stress protein n=1 Tax=Halovenus salina TaxID=1510225 RepID=A0ABD5W3P3_9EURY|nr:universal stress protein [Halovenus salina]